MQTALCAMIRHDCVDVRGPKREQTAMESTEDWVKFNCRYLQYVDWCRLYWLILIVCSGSSQKSKRKIEPDGKHGKPGVVVLSCSLRNWALNIRVSIWSATYARSFASLLWHRSKDKVQLCLRYCVMQHGLHRDMLGLPRLEHCPCVFGSTIFTWGLWLGSIRFLTGVEPQDTQSLRMATMCFSSFVPTFIQPDWTCSQRDRIWLWFFSTTYFM